MGFDLRLWINRGTNVNLNQLPKNQLITSLLSLIQQIK